MQRSAPKYPVVRRRFLLGAALLLGSLCLAPHVLAGDGRASDEHIRSLLAPEHVRGELLIRFKSGTTGAKKAQLRARVHARHERETGLGKGRYPKRVSLLKLTGGVGEHAALKQLLQDDAVLYAEPNYRRFKAQTFPNDELFSQSWGLHNNGQTGGTPDADIDAPEAWDLTTGSANIIIAVLDEGLDYDHPDLAANMWTNTGEIPGNGIDDDGDGFIDDIHGADFFDGDGDPKNNTSAEDHATHVAGIIGARADNGTGVAGVNWTCRIMALRFLGPQGGTTQGIIGGVAYAIGHGARVINMSFAGGGFSQAEFDAFAAARAAGIILVAAAGNDGTDNDGTPAYPANYDLDNIISVAGTDDADQFAWFSNWGANTVDLAAPGLDILSLQPINRYQLMSGTSMAAPYATGAVGLLLANSPPATPVQVGPLLRATVDQPQSLSGKLISEGRLNVGSAVRTLSGLQTTVQVLLKNGFQVNAGEPFTASCFAHPAPASITATLNGVAIPLTDPDNDFVYSAVLNAPLAGGVVSVVFDVDGFQKTVVGGAARSYLVTEGYPYTPVTLTGNATVLNPADDDSILTSLGFPFDFLGTPYTQVYVNSNGNLTFNGPDTRWSNTDLGASTSDMIAGCWDDLSPQLGNGQVRIETFGAPGSRSFVAEWRDIQQFGMGGGSAGTFQVVLFEQTSDVVFHYISVSPWGNGISATVGIGESSFSFNQPALSDQTSLLFSDPARSLPEVTITQPSEGQLFNPSTSIAFAGTATDPIDGDLTAALQWNSSRDGLVGSGGSFASTLTAGAHTITASAISARGLSGSSAISVIVTAQPECSDGVDNDGDGLVDYPSDPGCFNPESTGEETACQNGIDDDGDGFTDFDGGFSINGSVDPDGPDPYCIDKAWRNRENRSRRCALGFEFTIVLAALLSVRRKSTS